MAEKQSEIGATLGLGEEVHRVWWKRPWVWGSVLVLIAVVMVVGVRGGDAPTVRYTTVSPQRGNLTVTVTATGTLEPVNQVDVGSELSGMIASVDVDYNDEVKRGEPLAALDTDALKAHLSEARASLASANAQVANAQATVTETRLDYRRCKDLLPQKMCSQSDLDKAKAAMERAAAGEAIAKAQVQMAQATLDVQETNLQKAVIRAPIDGIVLDRKVEPGQTVAASLQTPVLFTLAEDLSHMELLVAIDEADIGSVRVGQPAVFSVDAYPGREFHATLRQIRRAPKTVDGVVTYESVLLVDNSDLALLPGMTATAEVTVQSLKDVLLIPSAALRYAPPKTVTTSRAGGLLGMLLPRHQHSTNGGAESKEVNGRQRIWVLRNGVPNAVLVKLGATDGAKTQVLEGELGPADQVIVDSQSTSK